jgi:Rod binding domain-containing protein
MDKLHGTNAAPLPVRAMTPVHKPTSPSALPKDAVQAADQFETLMALQLVKSMQSSLDGGNLLGSGVAGDTYSSLTEWELARVLARGTPTGLKKTILQQLSAKEKRP